MRIMGIDPGTLATGYGIIDKSGSRLSFVGAGCVRNAAGEPLPARFAKIHRELSGLFDRYRPDHVAVEEVFFCKNVKSAVKLGEARGVAMLVAGQRGVQVFEYAPRRVKQAVMGSGGAQKRQVQYMVKVILNMDAPAPPADAADALAIAVCHAFAVR